MSLLTIRPNAAGSSAQHARNGGTSNWARCSEASSDGDTTYCYNLTAGDGFPQIKSDLYNLGNSGGEAGAITLVKVNVVARYAILDGGGYARVQVGIRVGTSSYYASAVDLTGSYTAYSAQWATNPAGGNWTWTAINALQTGYLTNCLDGGAGATTEARVTQVYVEVTFDRAFVPGSPAIIVAAGQQPAFAYHKRFEPAAAAVAATALVPGFAHHQLFAPNDPALVQALGGQPGFQHHQLFAPGDPALLQVLGLEPGFRHGDPPEQGTPFTLVSRVPDAFQRSDPLTDFTLETRAVGQEDSP